MMHKIAEVEISNFRSCENLKIKLANFTPLIGYNNAGKSNIIKALEWAIDATSLGENDFFDKSKPVEVLCNVSGIVDETLDSLGVHKSRIEPHVVDGKIKIRTIQMTPDCSSREIKREIWQPKEQKWGNPQGIANAIKILFPDVIRIEAMIDINSDLASNKTTTTIGKLIKAIMEPITNEQGAKIQTVLKELSELFSASGSGRAQALTDFDAQATEAIQEFFPGVRARLDAPPPDIKEIFKSGKLVFSEDTTGTDWRDIQYYGHGVLRAAQMAMIKMLANVSGSASTGRVILLIDEPELYMHPQMIASIRDALRKLSFLGYQVVFSTHSPQMIGRSDINDTVIVSKRTKATAVKKTLRECCEDINGCDTQINQLMLDINTSSNFLFSDKIVFIEGQTEKEILPELTYVMFKENQITNRTAFLPLNGCSGLPKTRQVLNALDIPHKAIVDLDFAFTSGKDLQIWSDEDPLYQQCLQIFNAIANDQGYLLRENKLFRKGNGKSAEEGYHAFAISEAGKELIPRIKTQFLYHKIWIWSLGSIEYELGMTSKGGDAIRSFITGLLEHNPAEYIEHYDEISNAIKWAFDIE